MGICNMLMHIRCKVKGNPSCSYVNRHYLLLGSFLTLADFGFLQAFRQIVASLTFEFLFSDPSRGWLEV